jgi:hypothetical protein
VSTGLQVQGGKQGQQNVPIEFKQKPVDCTYITDDSHFTVKCIVFIE